MLKETLTCGSFILGRSYRCRRGGTEGRADQRTDGQETTASVAVPVVPVECGGSGGVLLNIETKNANCLTVSSIGNAQLSKAAVLTQPAWFEAPNSGSLAKHVDET